MTDRPDGARPRVVIVGAGFGGLNAAIGLKNAAVDVTIVDRRNHHLFQPLLYQVATAALSPADIAMPIRRILSRQKNTTVILGDVEGVDPAEKAVQVGRRRIPFDQLVIATGAGHAYFGHDEWARFAPGLKQIEDATDIRRRLLLAFERAETAETAEERRRLLNFVVIGAGPTGVEMAGSMVELAKRALVRDFHNIDPRDARVVLVEAGPRVLPAMPEDLSEKAKRSLERLAVEVRLNQPVTGVDADGVELGGGGAPERIESGCVVWAAGVAASPVAKWLGVAAGKGGLVEVAPDLSVPGHPDIFVIGDVASVEDHEGKPVPGIAPAAKQMGGYVARVIRARAEGRESPPPFRYRHLGSLATIGRRVGVADFGRIRLSGAPAWWLWASSTSTS